MQMITILKGCPVHVKVDKSVWLEHGPSRDTQLRKVSRVQPVRSLDAMLSTVVSPPKSVHLAEVFN